MKTTLSILAAVAGVLSALAWVKSALVFVKAPPGVGKGAVYGGAVYDDDAKGRRFDVLGTLVGQSKWNRVAAIWAAVAAALQAASIYNW